MFLALRQRLQDEIRLNIRMKILKLILIGLNISKKAGDGEGKNRKRIDSSVATASADILTHR